MRKVSVRDLASAERMGGSVLASDRAASPAAPTQVTVSMPDAPFTAMQASADRHAERVAQALEVASTMFHASNERLAKAIERSEASRPKSWNAQIERDHQGLLRSVKLVPGD